VTHDLPGERPGDPLQAHPALLPTVRALAVADVVGAQAPQLLYAATDPGWQFDTRKPEDAGAPPRRLTGAAVFRSVDGAKSWAMVGHDDAGLTGADVRALEVAPVTDQHAPATVYAGTAKGVFKTTDGGTSWTTTDTVGLTASDVRALAIDPTSPAIVYAGTANGVFKTTDGGTSWAATDAVGLTASDVRALAIDPTTPAIVYAGTANGVFKTTDGGTSWAATDTVGLKPSNRPAGMDVRALAIHPATPHSQTPTVVYAGTGGGVFRTVDGGTTWQDTTATYYGGAYKTTSGLADNLFAGCYSESGQGSGSEFIWPTLVLGGKLGGGFGPSTNASLITNVPGTNGVVGLPLRSEALHKVRKVIGDPIKGAVFGAYETDDDVILADASAGAMVIVLPPVLPPAPDLTGHELTIKKVDSTNNVVLIEAADAAPIDGIVKDITLDAPL
jgi:hypothetical protein